MASLKTSNPMGDKAPSAGLQVFVNNPAETRFNILGVEMQIVNVELKPGQSIEVSPGAMMHHGPTIYAVPHCSCSCSRYLTGVSNVYITYENRGKAPEIIGLTPNYPAKIIPLDLSQLGPMVCRPDSFMCGVGKKEINLSCNCCNSSCCLGDVGLFMQKLSGDGICFLQAGGTILEKTLEADEKILVDSDSLVAWQQTVTIGIRSFAGVCGCCSYCFGGEGCFMASMSGPGKIYITSMSYRKWHTVLDPGFASSAKAKEQEADAAGSTK
jgi:uncharacterized protein (AIM24 family)